MSPLQQYMMQRKLNGQGANGLMPQQGTDPGSGMAGSGAGSSGAGSGAQPAQNMGPGVADPYNEGDFGPGLTNPQDGQNEFDPRRRTKPYMAMGMPGMGMPPGGNGGMNGQGY